MGGEVPALEQRGVPRVGTPKSPQKLLPSGTVFPQGGTYLVPQGVLLQPQALQGSKTLENEAAGM